MNRFLSLLAVGVMTGLAVLPSQAKADTFITFVSNSGRPHYQQTVRQYDPAPRYHHRHHRHYEPPRYHSYYQAPHAPVRYTYATSPVRPTYRTQVIRRPSSVITNRDSALHNISYTYRR